MIIFTLLLRLMLILVVSIILTPLFLIRGAITWLALQSHIKYPKLYRFFTGFSKGLGYITKPLLWLMSLKFEKTKQEVTTQE